MAEDHNTILRLAVIGAGGYYFATQTVIGRELLDIISKLYELSKDLADL